MYIYLDKEFKSLMNLKGWSMAVLYSKDLVIFRNSMPNADYKEVVTLESLARYQTGRVTKSLVLFSIISTMHVYILSTISLSFHWKRRWKSSDLICFLNLPFFASFGNKIWYISHTIYFSIHWLFENI